MLSPASILARLTGWKCAVCRRFRPQVVQTQAGALCLDCVRRAHEKRQPMPPNRRYRVVA